MRVSGVVLVALALAGCASERAEQSVPEIAAEEPADIAIKDASEDEAEASNEAVVSFPAKKQAACAASEEPLFSCTVSNGKRIAVCASAKGDVEYRYGKGDAELVLGKPQWATVPYSGGGEAQIAFDNGDTRYIVFSRMVRTNFEPGEPNYPAISDGVIVLRGDEVLSVRACDGPGELKPVDYNVAERLIAERRRELFTYETSRADPKRVKE